MKKILWLFILGSFCLMGCGVKPKHLAAPDGADPDAYPKTYPAR